MRILAATLLTFAATQAHALCQPGEEPFMTCTFQDGRKAVDVCVHVDQVITASYRFGPTGGTPELALTVPNMDLDYTPWPGVGGSIWERLVFTNNDVEYDVYASRVRGADENGNGQPARGGIEVRQNGTVLATLICDKGSVDFPWTDVLAQ